MELAILNVGAGDTKLSFNPKKPAEVKHARKVIQDLLKRGFAILVEVAKDDDGEPLYRRAKGFDPKTDEYLIVGSPEEHDASKPRKTRKTKKPTERRIPARKAKAVAVSRSAGG